VLLDGGGTPRTRCQAVEEERGMCGRYVLNLTPEEIERRFGITEFVQLRLPPVMPRFNVAPTSVMPVVVEHREGRTLAPLKWGFWPDRMAPGRTPPPINARAETVATNGLFKRALARQRCIVPATGFFEWAVAAGRSARRRTTSACGAASRSGSPASTPRPPTRHRAPTRS
jgi:putative SOS response-associated peptidase YedK